MVFILQTFKSKIRTKHLKKMSKQIHFLGSIEKKIN